MGDRRERTIRIACIVLGAVLGLQLAVLVVHASFSRGLTIPALPSLPPEADGAKNTNSAAGTNVAKGGTNSAIATNAMKGATNSGGTNVASKGAAKSSSTNAVAASLENAKTNGEAISERATTADTNISIAMKGGKTNSSNIVVAATNKESTNSASSKTASKKSGPGSRPGAPTKMAELPPQVKERVDRIVQGEILAPVMRPMPMALLGIGGQSAILRSPDGQTGVVKEGDTLGSIKLISIGTNRVLIEQDGEKKELTIFDGLGSESLLPKPDKTTNEPAKKTH
jgi:hypothetical protein